MTTSSISVTRASDFLQNADFGYFLDKNSGSRSQLAAMVTNIKIQALHQFLLWVLPAVLIIAGLVFAKQMFPIFAGAGGYDYDPAYVYLFSGLNIIDGHSPHHIDHPGTPLQVLTSLVVVVQWLVLRLVGNVTEDVTSSVLYQPEQYVFTVSMVLLVLNAFAVHYFGRRIFQSAGNLKLALFCQSAPLAFWVVAPRIVYFSPEALLVFASVTLLGLLAPFMVGSNDSPSNMSRSTSVLAGIICGFGIAVKITFVPMALLLFLLADRSRVVLSLKYMVIAWVVCVLPILGSIARMMNQFYSFAVHSGKYGAGKTDIIAIDQAPGRMVDLVEAFPFFYAMLLVLSAVLMLKVFHVVAYKANADSQTIIPDVSNSSRTEGFNAAIKNSSIRVPLLLVLVGIFQTILVLKHPGPHYMLPVLPVAFVGVAWLIQMAEKKWHLDTVMLVLAGVFIISSVSAAYNDLRDSRLIIDDSMESIQVEMAKYTDPLVIGAYRCVLPECALAFGVNFAPELSGEAARFLANFYDYHIWSRTLNVHGEGWVGVDRLSEEVAKGRDILLVSPKHYESLNVFSLDLVVETQTQSLYRVAGLSGEL